MKVLSIKKFALTEPSEGTDWFLVLNKWIWNSSFCSPTERSHLISLLNDPKTILKIVGLAAHECSNFWGQQTYECNSLDLNKTIPENDLPVKRIILKFWAKALKSLLSVKFAITFIKNLDSFHIRLRSQEGIKF